VTVVEEDIDASSYEQVDWAFSRWGRPHCDLRGHLRIAHRPDPSTPMHNRDVSRLGTDLWKRELIDATPSWKTERRAEWGGERFPPTVRPTPEDEARVRER
jgi:3-polyprenyl-4-hydroxybenzoate decarboxylase